MSEQLGPYRVEGVLGQGGMGRVLRSTHPESGVPVAIKELSAPDEELLIRFRREAEVMRRLRHPNVVQVHDWLELGARSLLVLELCDGEDLAQRLRREGRLEEGVALGIMTEVAAGVAAAHAAGLVHRDLKPGNVLFQDGRAKVTDFGLVRWSGAESLTETGTLLGTPAYMAPEQIQDPSAVSPQADVFSLGVILYELLEGRRPWVGATPIATLTAILEQAPAPFEQAPAHLRALVQRCLERAPNRRFATAGELLAAVEDLQARPPAPRSRLPFGALALLLPLGLVAWGLVRSGAPTPAPRATTPHASATPSAVAKLPTPTRPPSAKRPPIEVSPLSEAELGVESPKQAGQLALQLCLWGAPDRARRVLEEATRRWPQADLLTHQAFVFRQLGELGRAKERLETELGLGAKGPRRARVLAHRLLLEALDGAPTEALSAGYRQLVREAPDDLAARATAHEALELVGHPLATEAEVALREDFRSAPGFPSVWAKVLARRGELTGLRSIEASGLVEVALLNRHLARAALVRGDLGLAREAVDRVFPAEPRADRWGRAFLRLRIDLAREDFLAVEETLAALDRGLPSWKVLAARAELALARGESKQAAALARQALGITRDRPQLLVILGRAIEDPALAANLFEQALVGTPEVRVQAYVHRARLRLRHAQIELARADARAAQRLARPGDPHREQALELLAQAEPKSVDAPGWAGLQGRAEELPVLEALRAIEGARCTSATDEVRRQSMRAELLLRRADYAGALSQFDAVLASKRLSAAGRALFGLLRINALRGTRPYAGSVLLREEVACLEAAVSALPPDSPSGRIARYRLALLTGNPDPARPSERDLLAHPLGRRTLLQESKPSVSAAELLAAYQEHEGGTVQTRLARATLARRERDWLGVLAACEGMEELFPPGGGDLELYDLRLLARFELERAPGAPGGGERALDQAKRLWAAGLRTRVACALLASEPSAEIDERVLAARALVWLGPKAAAELLQHLRPSEAQRVLFLGLLPPLAQERQVPPEWLDVLRKVSARDAARLRDMLAAMLDGKPWAEVFPRPLPPSDSLCLAMLLIGLGRRAEPARLVTRAMPRAAWRRLLREGWGAVNGVEPSREALEELASAGAEGVAPFRVLLDVLAATTLPPPRRRARLAELAPSSGLAAAFLVEEEAKSLPLPEQVRRYDAFLARFGALYARVYALRSISLLRWLLADSFGPESILRTYEALQYPVRDDPRFALDCARALAAEGGGLDPAIEILRRPQRVDAYGVLDELLVRLLGRRRGPQDARLALEALERLRLQRAQEQGLPFPTELVEVLRGLDPEAAKAFEARLGK